MFAFDWIQHQHCWYYWQKKNIQKSVKSSRSTNQTNTQHIMATWRNTNTSQWDNKRNESDWIDGHRTLLIRLNLSFTSATKLKIRYKNIKPDPKYRQKLKLKTKEQNEHVCVEQTTHLAINKNTLPTSY